METIKLEVLKSNVKFAAVNNSRNQSRDLRLELEADGFWGTEVDEMQVCIHQTKMLKNRHIAVTVGDEPIIFKLIAEEGGYECALSFLNKDNSVSGRYRIDPYKTIEENLFSIQEEVEFEAHKVYGTRVRKLCKY